MSAYTYQRTDATHVPALQAPDRAYLVLDERGRVRCVVAGSGANWAAGWVGPTRSRPVIPGTVAETRSAAVDRLLRGRP